MPKHIEDILDTDPMLRDSASRESLRVWAAVEDFVEKHFPAGFYDAGVMKEVKESMMEGLTKALGLIKEDPNGKK